MSVKVVFTTERGTRHQEDALKAAPDELSVNMLRQPDRDALKAALSDTIYFISERTGLIDAELIEAAPQLKLIQRLGSLTHDIDLKAARAAGVAVCYWPVDSVIRVAEHLILQMLVLAKKLREVEAVALAADSKWGDSRRTDEDTFAYNWSGRSGVKQLWQQKVGIMGFGEIGAEVAQRLRGWECQILYHKRRRLPSRMESNLRLTYVSAETLYAESDYLINLLPYFPSTDHLLNADVFTQMKDGAFVVSCGSGSTIDEAALAEAIEGGKLSGAALDTFEWEPLRRENPLLALAKKGYNVLLTPHTAAGTVDEADVTHSRQQDYTNIMNHLAQRPLRYQVV
ncbi:MAG: NAD(P)-dependent oxidoreductase [Ardenticatenaceae bacterium]|nr:NAD(P)-dependent oxidoreductase [Ardenticatenaceae bacterium]